MTRQGSGSTGQWCQGRQAAQTGVTVALIEGLLRSRSRTNRARPTVRQVLLDEPGTEWSMVMAWRRHAYLSQAARAWLDLVREVHGADTHPKPDG
ncbi:hypothetical protein JWJ88_10455 [Paracoccus methylovorus]|uniref:LysR substrate-binding domain-containing protein n=1 Tax=Paracoccus methylovorus TaxID=2812658 RepID=A0ABX7JJ00_9RHOB|nr:hypothetical protein JWJ88_10455 [Paracoccus methylovorus]